MAIPPGVRTDCSTVERDYMPSNGNFLVSRGQGKLLYRLAGSMRACALMFWIVALGT
jgi:hypothetical protein